MLKMPYHHWKMDWLSRLLTCFQGRPITMPIPTPASKPAPANSLQVMTIEMID